MMTSSAPGYRTFAVAFLKKDVKLIDEKKISWFVKTYQKQQRFVHCEIVFPLDGRDFYNDEDGKNVAYAVFNMYGVVKMTRTFSNPNYRWIFVTVTEREYRYVAAFCDLQFRFCSGKDFYDKYGVIRSFFWPKPALASGYWRKVLSTKKIDRREKLMEGIKWWCASFVSTALIEIGMLAGYNPYSLEVDNIYDALDTYRTNRLFKVHVDMSPKDVQEEAKEHFLFGKE
jgi:hypothetical protein